MPAVIASAPSRTSGLAFIPPPLFFGVVVVLGSVPRGPRLTSVSGILGTAVAKTGLVGGRRGRPVESHRDGEGRSPLGYMPQLDALRALAAFGVFVQHF